MGLGVNATYVIVDLRTALADCQIVVPAVTDLSGWETAKDVTNIPSPEENGLVGFEGSSVFLPTPFLHNAILASGTKEPFELIPIITEAARTFNSEHEEGEMMTSLALIHADDLNAWLYSVKVGSINETRYQINPDDVEVTAFCKEWHVQRIKGLQGTAASLDDISVISQLTNAISTQNKEAIKIKQTLPPKYRTHNIEKEETKKDRTHKIHPSIIKMIGLTSAKSLTDESEALPTTCTRFLNSDNVEMAQCKPIHQFKELVFPYIGFAQGMTQALYVNDFLYANSSTPSNFTVFAFHEQEPLLDSRQNDSLIFQSVQTQGQKKLLDKMKTSLKQTVHVPTNFNTIGTQLQLFYARYEIFFCNECICTTSLQQLLITAGGNKKTFRDHIA